MKQPSFAWGKSGVCERSAYILAIIAALSMLLLAFACGPSAPEKGTPAYFWAAAHESYAAGDYLKTIDDLDGILDSDNEYTARAVPWSLLLTSGLANGYADLADHYQTGGKKNKETPGNFFKFVGSYRSQVGRLTLRFADNFAKYGNLKGDSVTLDFNFPPGSAEPVGQLETVAGGNLLPSSVADQTEKLALQRGVILAIARAAGSPDDAAKAQATLKASQGKITRNMYLVSMANCLFDASQLYSERELNDSEKEKILMDRALEVIKPLPESFETKDLGVRIRLAQKEPTT
jgi:hypothetical protein